MGLPQATANINHDVKNMNSGAFTLANQAFNTISVAKPASSAGAKRSHSNPRGTGMCNHVHAANLMSGLPLSNQQQQAYYMNSRVKQ